MKIEVLGTGCKACKKLYEDILETTKEINIDCEVFYVDDMEKLIEYNVMSVPALIIDNELISSGKVYKKKEILKLLMGQKCRCTDCNCNVSKD